MKKPEILLDKYWSKADSFVLPLTGLNRNETYEMCSYFFWNEFSIEDYKLILKFTYDEDYDKFLEYARVYIFPILDKKGYLIESYDFPTETVFILDMSEWAMDIEFILAGKYSLLTKEAKAMIEKFHLFLDDGWKLPQHIFASLYPTTKITRFDDKSAIEYVSEEYGLDLDELTKVGELGGKYDKMNETLLLNIEDVCHLVT